MEIYEQLIKRQIDKWFNLYWTAVAYTASITLINEFVHTKRIDFITEWKLISYVEHEKLKIFNEEDI